MTLEELKSKKQEFIDNVNILIRAFEKETKVEINDINITCLNVTNKLGEKNYIFNTIEIELNIL